jgi:1,5-anhydro-D-fructose reductase (1,5-anhydro-D-mannitol-forming)
MLPDTLNNFTVYGTDGRFTGTATVWDARMGSLEVVSETVNQTQDFKYDYLANFVAEISDFHSALKEDREPTATGPDGLRSTEVNSAVIESAKTGRAVKIDRRLA